MRYNLKNESEQTQASSFLGEQIRSGKTVEIKVVRPQRSLRSNAYLHVLLSICALEWGFSLAEYKTIYKRDICPGIYVYYKNEMPFVRSSADLDTKQISDSIEQLKAYCAENGLTLPEPNDETALNYWQGQIERSQYV